MKTVIENINWTQIIIWLGGIFIACLFLRGGLIKLLPRLRWKGSEISLDPPQQPTASQPDVQTAADRLMRAFDNELLVEQDANIRNELRRDNLLDRLEAIPILIRHLAASQVAYAFETFYRTIYGSQLRFLEFLNQQQTGIPRDTAQPFFDAVAALHPQVYSGWNLARWLRWMLNSGLIREDNGVLQITVRGRHFLAYLTNLGLGRNLPF